MARRRLPGNDLIDKGVSDLRRGIVTIESLLVSMAPTALRRVGLDIPEPLTEPETRLFRILGESHGNGAHSRYNAYRRLLTSYLRAARCARTSIEND